MMKRLQRAPSVAYAWWVVSLVACGASASTPTELDSGTRDTGADAAAADAAALQDAGTGASLFCVEPVSKGALADPDLDEVSGLARSYRFAGTFWAVNDSGPPVLHRVSLDGATQASWEIAGASHDDWEDVSSYQADGKAWVLIADTGDNNARTGGAPARDELLLFRFEEGEEPPTAEQVETLSFTYPNGPRDCEALFVDPANQDIWFITKNNDSRMTEVYMWPYPQTSGDQPSLVHTLALGASSSFLNSATSADLSDDRRRLWLRTYSEVLLWELTPAEPIADAIKREPTTMPSPPELQGEAIVDDGGGFVTIAEGSGATIYQSVCAP